MNRNAKQPTEAANSGYFLNTQDEPRVRRARDAVQIGVGLLLLLVAASDHIRLGSLQGAVREVTLSLPGWADLIFWSGYGIAALYALTIVAGALARAGRNPQAARDVVLAVGGAVALTFLVMQLKEGSGQL